MISIYNWRCSIYNNEVTYDKKWDTEENRVAQEKLRDRFFDKTVCCSDCPVGWAPEVLELLERLDKEFGIRYNESSLRGYVISGSWMYHLSVGPFVELARGLFNNFVKHVFKQSPITGISKTFSSFTYSYTYGVRCFKAQVLYPILNKILKPQISLDQVKEKYGELRIYYSAPAYLDDYIEDLISEAEIKLAIKGCYYPVEAFYYGGSSYNIDVDHEPISIKNGKDYDGEPNKSVTKYRYRSIMKSLGLDLNEIKKQANKKKKKK